MIEMIQIYIRVLIITYFYYSIIERDVDFRKWSKIVEQAFAVFAVLAFVFLKVLNIK